MHSPEQSTYVSGQGLHIGLAHLAAHDMCSPLIPTRPIKIDRTRDDLEP